MRERQIPVSFPDVLLGVKNYSDLQTRVIGLMNEAKQGGVQRIGFVSGSVASQGRDNIRRNMKLLEENGSSLARQLGFPVFSSTEIFTSGIWDTLPETTLPPKERSGKMKELFRGILSGGVTDVFMMPGWEESEGAVDEYNAAQVLGLTTHFILPKFKV